VPSVAEVVRRYGAAYLDDHGGRVLPSHRAALCAIASCRTAAAGGHVYRCPQCDTYVYRYHSCRNRACPACHRAQTQAWLAARRAELIDVPYFHLVFTVPEALRRFVRSHQRAMLDVLFRAAWLSLDQLARHPRYLGGQIGAMAVLHTWTRALEYHPHLHVLVPGVALADDGRAVCAHPRFLVPVRVLSRLFAGRVFALARAALPGERLPFIAAPRWVVWCAPAVQGTDRVLSYCARYVFRQAITDARLSSIDGDVVRFRVTSHDARAARLVTLTAHEFLRRFLQHVLPRGLHKVRFYGLWHPAQRAMRTRLVAALAVSSHYAPRHTREAEAPPLPFRCPSCGTTELILLGRLPRKRDGASALDRSPPHTSRCPR
jgi:predicted RNA-binding Zn-ribbon protein involved in translation (DUF1610 family)